MIRWNCKSETESRDCLTRSPWRPRVFQKQCVGATANEVGSCSCVSRAVRAMQTQSPGRGGRGTPADYRGVPSLVHSLGRTK